MRKEPYYQLVDTDGRLYGRVEIPVKCEGGLYNLEAIKQQVQKMFDFPIYLDHPYKLCDYKPAYGYIFPEYTKGYDYWGHCDMTDCIFGNLRKF